MAHHIPVKDKISPHRHIKVAPFRKETRVTTPHRHNQYFEIVYLSGGRGVHWIDGIRYEVKPPVLFFINRDQLHYWELQSEPAGYVVILRNSFLHQSKDESLKQLLQQVWHANCLYLRDTREMNVLFRLLVNKQCTSNTYEHHVLDGLLKALIALILAEGRGQLLHTGQQTQLYARYIDLLLTRKEIERQVGLLAKELGTSAQNLNAACRKAVNKTASGILDDFILSEARRLLLYTDSHVNEIAYRLNFRDPSYFIKYFKKHQQVTPETFRQSGFHNYHL